MPYPQDDDDNIEADERYYRSFEEEARQRRVKEEEEEEEDRRRQEEESNRYLEECAEEEEEQRRRECLGSSNRTDSTSTRSSVVLVASLFVLLFCIPQIVFAVERCIVEYRVTTIRLAQHNAQVQEERRLAKAIQRESPAEDQSLAYILTFIYCNALGWSMFYFSRGLIGDFMRWARFRYRRDFSSNKIVYISGDDEDLIQALIRALSQKPNLKIVVFSSKTLKLNGRTSFAVQAVANVAHLSYPLTDERVVSLLVDLDDEKTVAKAFAEAKHFAGNPTEWIHLAVTTRKKQLLSSPNEDVKEVSKLHSEGQYRFAPFFEKMNMLCPKFHSITISCLTVHPLQTACERAEIRRTISGPSENTFPQEFAEKYLSSKVQTSIVYAKPHTYRIGPSTSYWPRRISLNVNAIAEQVLEVVARGTSQTRSLPFYHDGSASLPRIVVYS